MNASTWLLDEQPAGRLAIRQAGLSYTYGELVARTVRVAAGFRSAGVRPEERVFLSMLDGVDYVAAFLGAMRIGAVPVPVNPLLPDRDRQAVAAQAGARIVVTDRPPEADGPDDPYEADDETPGFWLCTSGSTGQPKLAMHRQADLRVTAATYAATVLKITGDDRCYSVGPMFHAYGLGNSLTFPFSVGAAAVLEPPRPPTPARVAEVVRTEQPTLFFCVPTFYAALCASDIPDDTFASVRHAVSAAEALPAETFHRFRDRFGVEILDGIGSTEMAHIYCSNRPGAVRPGASGYPVDGYELRVLDDEGRMVADGDPGGLHVRGESMATGYWRNASASRRTFVGEWMRTGDVYARDQEGAFTYLGRSDDMLRVSGEWVSPAEVEGVLMEHPSILEAAVVGERGELGGQRPVAYIVSRLGATLDRAEVIAFCRERLAAFKCPRRIEVTEALPKTATGKIQRFKLRAGS